MQNSILRDYKIGDICFRYIGPEFHETEYLHIFRVENSAIENPDVIYEMIKQEKLELTDEICVQQNRYIDIYQKDNERIRVIYDEKREHILMKDRCQENHYHRVEYDAEQMVFWNTNMMMQVFDIPNQVLLYDGIFLHASCVECGGKGIVFTAAKQTGKSTQAALWEKYREAEIINGDRILLRKTGDVWRGYGSPYAGTSRIFKNKSVPISAIAVLSQGTENKVSELVFFDALKALMEGCSYEIWDRNSVERVANIAQDLFGEIKFVKLECRPDLEAVETLERILW